MASAQVFRRFGIGIERAVDAGPRPPRFRVPVPHRRWAALVLGELLPFRPHLGVPLRRPCVSGVSPARSCPSTPAARRATNRPTAAPGDVVETRG